MTTPIVIRASSLPELFDCAARWEAKHIKSLRLPSSGNAVLGKAVHAATAQPNLSPTGFKRCFLK